MRYQGPSPIPGEGLWTPPWEERRDKVICQKGLRTGQDVGGHHGNNLPQNPKPVHFVQCQTPQGLYGFWCPPDVIRTSSRNSLYPTSGIGLKVTPPLPLFNKLGVLGGLGAQLDNEKVQVSQTWPLASQNCRLLRGKGLVLRGTEECPVPSGEQ